MAFSAYTLAYFMDILKCLFYCHCGPPVVFAIDTKYSRS